MSLNEQENQPKSQAKDMPVYATPKVQEELRKRFAYVFAENPYPGAPMIKLCDISKESAFEINDLKVTTNWLFLCFKGSGS